VWILELVFFGAGFLVLALGLELVVDLGLEEEVVVLGLLLVVVVLRELLEEEEGLKVPLSPGTA
jgi:hypothetical protein